MLSNRWTKNDIIPIKDFSFNDFKEFLLFIYSGKCNLNENNIMAMLDMAAFYQIKHLKEFCDKYLSETEIKFTNIFNFMEISNKYLMKQMKKPIQDFINQNFSAFIKSNEFLNANKTIIEEFVSYDLISPDEIFQAIYEWAEYQTTIKKEEESNENLNYNDFIKKELTEFLPKIDFIKMKLSFLRDYVVKKDFLFTQEELNNILKYVRCTDKVKITNLHGQSIYGSFTYYNTDAIETIKTLKNRESDNKSNNFFIFWKTSCEKPSTPSPLKKKDGFQWYLVHFDYGAIGVTHYSDTDNDDYLLAEMFSKTGFTETGKCKIEIE